mmetsp:Transcript_78338/g.242904  ORF Transcript_78338/g.242904 Transcript_78338/m.242904 type:complete len:281 (-) Transcript_78338:791-1633(-)
MGDQGVEKEHGVEEEVLPGGVEHAVRRRSAPQDVHHQGREHLAWQVPQPEVGPDRVEGQPLARPPRLLGRQARVRPQLRELGGGRLLDTQHALREVPSGVPVGHDVRDVVRDQVPVYGVQDVHAKPRRQERVHARQRIPIEARAVEAEEDDVPDHVYEVPSEHVHNERGDDVEVHARQDDDAEHHDVGIGREAKEGAQDLKHGADIAKHGCEARQVVVVGVVAREHELAVSLGPRLADHVLRTHQVGRVEVLEPRPELAPAGAQVEPSHEELDADDLALL